MRFALTAIVLTCLVPVAAHADPIEQSRKALQTGEYDKALRKLEPLADKGNADAQRLLGAAYYHGLGVDRSYEVAAGWFRKAADAGLAGAQMDLAEMYDDGEGVVRDYAEAARLFRAAAEQGEAAAVMRIASRHARGKGVARDPAAAVEWYRKAAAQDDPDAWYQLGFAYFWGHGVARDPARATELFARAADSGHDAARNRALPDVDEAPLDPRTRFEPEPCWFEPPAGRDAVCGWMHVPENRRRQSSPLIRFPVVVYRTPWRQPRPWPVLILARGGPGGSAYIDRDHANRYWETYDWQFLTEGRDVIVVDQRGAGMSKPLLDCPELAQADVDLLSRVATIEEHVAIGIDAVRRCRERLASEGIDVSAYDSAASAADIEDLRRALGYRQWDLYGVSYSGRWALSLARDHPAGVRSMILDSPAAPDTRLTDELAFVRDAFDELFETCDADPRCKRKFPDLRSSFARLHETLEAQPVGIVVTHPVTLQPFEVVTDGDRLVEMLFWGMYSEWRIEVMPLAITAATNGSYDLLAPFARNMLGEYAGEEWAEGLNLSAECREIRAFDDYEAARRVAERDPLFEHTLSLSLEWDRAACSVWNAGVSPAAEGDAVSSDIPALILSGRHDPVTRAPEAERMRSLLPNAYHHEFPGVAHGIMESEFCAEKVIVAFLADPDKDPFRTGCVQDLEELEFDDEP